MKKSPIISPKTVKLVDSSESENGTTPDSVNAVSDSSKISKPRKRQGRPLQWVKNGLRSFLEIEDSDKLEDSSNKVED